jgi:DNA-binding XRE family transcriptional regulator
MTMVQYGWNRTSHPRILTGLSNPRTDDIVCARTVRAVRQKRKLSQDVFAERAGLHRAHVGEIERGESNVTLQTLKIVADTLGVRIVDLVRKL